MRKWDSIRKFIDEIFSSDVNGNTDEAYVTTTKRYIYDAYGNQISENADDDNPYRYCGENYDEETGLYYLRARYYDPSIGRFLSEDPAQDGVNWYVYCENNPITRIDSKGENWITDRVYDVWNWTEDGLWKMISLGLQAYGWTMTADLISLAASGSGHIYIAGNGTYASNLVKNDTGIHQTVNDIIWTYGTSVGKTYISTPDISYEIPLSNGELGAALHIVSIQVNASVTENGWYANVTVTDTFDFTQNKNPLQQDTIKQALLWTANDIAYWDTEWGLLDAVDVIITYSDYY